VLFDSADYIDLNDIIKLPHTLSNGLYKCRVVYSEEIKSIEFSVYKLKNIQTLTIVYNDSINYSYKYENRHVLNDIMNLVNSDDIIIIKNGFVTDSSTANLVFFDGKKWITPTTFLLPGTQRSYLLDSGLIEKDEIKASDIKNFRGVKLINAMKTLSDSELIRTVNII
jgi:4-amino-4-deoxychorismate lyase